MLENFFLMYGEVLLVSKCLHEEAFDNRTRAIFSLQKEGREIYHLTVAQTENAHCCIVVRTLDLVQSLISDSLDQLLFLCIGSVLIQSADPLRLVFKKERG